MTSEPPDLGAAVTALDTIVELGPGRLDDAHVAEAAALRATIDERLALGDGLTVVAVAGGTGVGKSALANRLVGAPVAAEGVRRPTTSRPLAIAPAPADAPTTALLGWLDIEDRVTAPPGFPEGLVLLDLPDHDSVVAEHRTTAVRLARRVDGLLVVVDPVKYARADLHHGPLAALTDHAEVVTVVLNRIDELHPGDVERCLDDLASHLDAGGHHRPTIVATSAATGAGVGELQAQLRQLAETRTAARRRLVADVTALASRVAAELVTLPEPVPDTDQLLDALMEATDAHRLVAEAELAYRRDARRGVRSPLARVVMLPVRGATELARAFGIGDPAPTTSAPSPSVARIETVLARELRLQRTTGPAHAVLGDTIQRLASQGAPALADAVGGVGVRPPPRRWWHVVAAVRGIAETVALVGFGWLVLLGVADWLQLPDIPTPRLTEALTWPTALLIAGALARVLLGLGTRLAVGRGARRHRQRIADAVRRRLAAVTEERLLTPYTDELARHERLREAVYGQAGRP